ncbi:MAG: acyl carrier protein [Alphaproteobacteria bacterium]
MARVLRVPEDALAVDGPIGDATAMDSLTLAEIASALDDEFGIRVPGDDLSAAMSLRDLSELVGRSPRR